MKSSPIDGERVVSAAVQTRRASKQFTGGSQTLNVHNTDSNSFAQEQKNTYILFFSSSTK